MLGAMMSRQRKWTSDAERMRAKRGNPNTNSAQSERATPNPNAESEHAGNPNSAHDFVAFFDQAHVPRDPMAPPWSGCGRGVVRRLDGADYVLIARPDGHGVVSAADWQRRLAQRCSHGHAGWSCHNC